MHDSVLLPGLAFYGWKVHRYVWTCNRETSPPVEKQEAANQIRNFRLCMHIAQLLSLLVGVVFVSDRWHTLSSDLVIGIAVAYSEGHTPSPMLPRNRRKLHTPYAVAELISRLPHSFNCQQIQSSQFLCHPL